ncbi:hypothetical protein OnM2_035045 [Erysiphe neolycopersici]|uniref:Uncharacterized protein n=1 Tax=Erysiphe neolycopersici TaxID=212602 RepID=A0A420HXG3_9PEZI|nr:hypothetical protein OnM2_035045 [Erysiphe neolycopersici]
MFSIASPQNEQISLLLQHNPTAIIHRTKTDTKFTGLGDSIYDVYDFTEIDFYIRSKDNIIAHFQREIHTVENPQANALIGIDIASVEGWIIDLDAEKLTIPKCYGISVDITPLPGSDRNFYL